MKSTDCLLPPLLLLAALSSVGCGEKENVDVTPPAQITDVVFTPRNGGGFFTYKIPPDEDFLYTKAEYRIDNGELISKTSSVYSDTLFIEGLGQEKDYDVNLTTVDRLSNESVPVKMTIRPLAPTTAAVLGTVRILLGFSSLVVDWTNTLRQTITVCVNVTVGAVNAKKLYTSNLAKDRFIIDNLTGEPHGVKVYIRDSYQNQTEIKDFGEVTPFTDGPISKKQWTFLRDNLLYGNRWDYDSDPDPFKQEPLDEYKGTFRSDSMKNARMTYYEGRIEKFWDNEYDYRAKLNLNYFHTGPQSYPFSYFIDLGREVRGSRFKLWQRDSWGQLYGGENVEAWQIWVSDDKDPSDGVFDGWELVGQYKIVKPSSVIEANAEARNGHEFLFYPDDPHFTKAFRYLRFKAMKQYGNGTSGCSSEITLFGTDASGQVDDDPATLVKAKEGWE